MTVWGVVHVVPAYETLADAGRGRVWETTCERTRVEISPAAGGVPHQAHERLALPLREIREESNQVSEIGGHPKWSGMWSGICDAGDRPRAATSALNSAVSFEARSKSSSVTMRKWCSANSLELPSHAWTT